MPAALPAPYQYRTQPSARVDESATTPLRFNPNEENLTGYVYSAFYQTFVPASDIEERFARGLQKVELPFIFQFEIPIMGSLPGRNTEVDFVVGFHPIELNSPLGHTTITDKAEDALRERLINAAGQKMGWFPLETFWYWQLDTQEEADRLAREFKRIDILVPSGKEENDVGDSIIRKGEENQSWRFWPGGISLGAEPHR